MKVLNLDNLRAAVQQSDWCDPELNPKLLSFCRHYGCALRRVPACQLRTGRNEYLSAYSSIWPINSSGYSIFTSIISSPFFTGTNRG